MLKRSKQLLADITQISRLVADPKLSQSYYPLEPRKTKFRIAADLLLWYLRHDDVNGYYYLYGFDRRDSNTADYLPYPEFRSIRNRKNLHPGTRAGFSYVCILQDKFVFSRFLSSLGFPTPRVFALCDPKSFSWVDEARTDALEAMLQDGTRQFDGFCKPVMGINGGGAFPLKLSDGQLYRGSKNVTVEEVKRRIDGKYLIQERVEQHPTMSTLHPQSLNTLRIVTFNNCGNIRVFSAAQRMGTSGRSVDNWTAGGILVGIDLESGRLRAEGLYKPGYGGTVTRHPQTNVLFSGFEIPYFVDAVRLITRLHGYLYGIHSIGWDIAITNSGPIVIEGNDDWDGAVPMALESNFKRRFLEMYSS